MTFALRWTLLIALALLAGPVDAHVQADRLAPGGCDAPATASLNRPVVSPDLVEDLLGWIAAATDYDVTGARDDPPEITFCSAGDVIPYEAGTALVDDKLNGLYDLPNRRIVLVQPWDPQNAGDRSVLLHELIHHVQLANRTYECLEQPEWEAYQLQEAYLAEHGVESGFDWLQIYFLSQCPRDIHP